MNLIGLSMGGHSIIVFFFMCWNFVPLCLISFNLILPVSPFLKRSTASPFVSYQKLYLLASNCFFLVSVKENFLPPCGWRLSSHPHRYGIQESRSYDKGPDSLVKKCYVNLNLCHMPK